MRGNRTFKANVFRTTQGRWRWLVEIRGTGDVLGSGYTQNKEAARKEARTIQERNIHKFCTR